MARFNADAREPDISAPVVIQAKYVVGCDGANSFVPRQCARPCSITALTRNGSWSTCARTSSPSCRFSTPHNGAIRRVQPQSFPAA